jgi:alpha-aminoadipic semialdehyde synthase
MTIQNHPWRLFLEFDAKRVYGCIVTAKDYAKRTDGGQFEISDFMANPQNYTSNFHEKIAPYATMLVNGIYWDSRFPRLLTKDQVTELYVRKNLRLLSIADISCDIKGPIEFMDRASTMDQPFFYYDIDKKSVSLK